MLLVVVVALLLTSCDDDENFEGTDRGDLANKTFAFLDARAFGIFAAANLEVGFFGADALNDDEAPFTLASGNLSATGSLHLDENDNPLGRDFSRCEFEVDTSTIPEVPANNTVDTDCFVSSDGMELQVTNRDTDEVSTGTLVP